MGAQVPPGTCFLGATLLALEEEVLLSLGRAARAGGDLHLDYCL